MEESNIVSSKIFFFFVEDEKDRLVSRLLKNGNENILLWKMGRLIAILFYFFFKKTKKGHSVFRMKIELLFLCSKNERIDQFLFFLYEKWQRIDLSNN